jgi:predicted DNA-binding transcriptional regulator AlpA
VDNLLTLPEAAKLTRLSENTLRWMRHNGTGPKSGKLGRRIFYREADLIEWVNAQFEHSGQDIA